MVLGGVAINAVQRRKHGVNIDPAPIGEQRGQVPAFEVLCIERAENRRFSLRGNGAAAGSRSAPRPCRPYPQFKCSPSIIIYASSPKLVRDIAAPTCSGPNVTVDAQAPLIVLIQHGVYYQRSARKGYVTGRPDAHVVCS